MNKIAQFEKVSYEQFYNTMQDSKLPHTWGKNIREIYDNISIPKRSTAGSAGYDFITPIQIKLEPGETALIPTGIRVLIQPGWWLGLFPRSGLGFKYRCQLDNTVGVIDSDYYISDNEGHIMAKITNDGREHKTLHLNAGDRFMQGIFIPYGITIDDNADGVRNGGFGSTDAR